MRKRRGGLGAAARGSGFSSNVAEGLGLGPETLREVAPAELEPSPWQPREDMDPATLEELASSLRHSGVLEPLLAREKPGGRLELLAGHRRREAAVLAGLDTVPVRVLQVDDLKAQAVALTENLAREDLSPWEEAQGLHALRAALEREEGGKVSRERLAKIAGRGAGTVSESLTIAAGLDSATLEAAKVNRQTLTKLPKTALLNASRGKNTRERAALLVAAMAALKSPGEAPGKATGRTLKKLRKKKRSGPPERAYTLTNRLDTAGRLSLQLRKPPEKMQEGEAEELLERLEPIVERLRRRAGGEA